MFVHSPSPNLGPDQAHEKDDGYRLTYGGYDYLAMRALSKRDSMHSVGNQIGVGKESGQAHNVRVGAPLIISIQTSTLSQTPKVGRWFSKSIGMDLLPCTSTLLNYPSLGRVSFRTIKEKRDYLGKRKSASWMYMSRLAAQKEWAFMKVGKFSSP